jgi:hypothetical protein
MRKHLSAPLSIAPLAVFRVLFGFVMAVSVLRFALMGWIGELYVAPTYHFTFYGFGWVQPLGAVGMHALFAVMGLAAVGVMLGWRYRLSAATFFLLFTYVELIDKANYLNHYYFVSIVAGMLVFLPAHRAFSLDVRRRPALRADTVPAWTVNALKLQLGIVYVFAGLAKLHPDWLLEAMPLQLWLPAHAHLPVVGSLLAEVETAYLFSWAGAIYDLTVPFFLLWGRTRPAAYVAVVGFHLTTAALFPIGMFPYIMIACTLVFFSPRFHERVIEQAKALGRALAGRTSAAVEAVRAPIHVRFGRRASTALGVLFAVHFALQLALPLRAFAYPGDLFWTEQGYRFSWRVMLMEKAGYAVFHVRDPETGRQWEVANYEHLTPNQEKMMATQPDMILQFAHHLEEEYRRQGIDDVEINVRAHATLNGRPSQLLIDPTVDLTAVEPGLGPKAWVLPFDDTEDRWVDRKR